MTKHNSGRKGLIQHMACSTSLEEVRVGTEGRTLEAGSAAHRNAATASPPGLALTIQDGLPTGACMPHRAGMKVAHRLSQISN